MYINKGMYLEKLLDNTIVFYLENDSFFMIKYHTKNAITKRNKFLYIANNFVDYFGIYKNKFFVIEAKQCQSNIFNFKRINDKQHKVLSKLIKMNLIAYVLIYFVSSDQFFLVKYNEIKNRINNNKKSIKYDEIRKIGFELNVILPGILNIKEIFDIEFIKIKTSSQ